MKELGPYHELRLWFGHDPERWQEFKRRYCHELEESGGVAQFQELARRARREPMTLVFSSKEETYNSAQTLKEFMDIAITGK